jgi:hypothetical protein
MPNLEEHCKRTRVRYHADGRDIHSWLDEPSQHYVGGHRQFRHDTDTVKAVGDLFGSKYGRAVAENIALDHIMADHEDEIRKRHDGTQEQIQQQKPPKPPEIVNLVIPQIKRYFLPLILMVAMLGASMLYMAIVNPAADTTIVFPQQEKFYHVEPVNLWIGLYVGWIVMGPIILLLFWSASKSPRVIQYQKYEPTPQPPLQQSEPTPWHCEYCSHANVAISLACGHCGAQKPKT